jgi:hypothetical protein
MLSLLTPFIAQIKAYATGILVGLALVVLLGLGIKIGVLTHQRNIARSTVASQALTIQGYQIASDAARARVDVAVEKSEISDQKHAALITDLHASLPKTPDAALAWAIQSGKKINEATR